MKEKINKFIEQLKLEFDFENDFIGFYYEDDGHFYNVWHTNEALEATIDNRRKVSELLRKNLTREEARNVIVSYSYSKELELKENKISLNNLYKDVIEEIQISVTPNLSGNIGDIYKTLFDSFSGFAGKYTTNPIHSKVFKNYSNNMKNVSELLISHNCDFNSEEKKSYSKTACQQNVEQTYALAS